jgi:hypothetical protein
MGPENTLYLLDSLQLDKIKQPSMQTSDWSMINGISKTIIINLSQLRKRSAGYNWKP